MELLPYMINTKDVCGVSGAYKPGFNAILAAGLTQLISNHISAGMDWAKRKTPSLGNESVIEAC